MSQIQAGSYKGRILNYGIEETQKGDLKVVVEFQLKKNDVLMGKLKWSSGFYSQKNTEITLENLVTMGLLTPDVTLLANGIESKALDTNRVYDLTVEQRPHWKYEGQFISEIKYINREGEGSKEPELVDAQTARSKLAAVGGISAAFKAAKEKAEARAGAPAGDIPF